MAEEVKILSLIPESLHETLIKEVQEVIKEREQQKPGIIHPGIKDYIANQAPITKQKK